MEDLEMQKPRSTMEGSEDLCSFVLARFGNSTQEDHQHLCSVIGAISQELKDQGLPLTVIAYFGATISSLDQLSDGSGASDPVITALLTLLSMILPRVSVAVLRKKRHFVSEPIVRVLRSESLTMGAAMSGLKCISQLLLVSDKASWLEISKLYYLLLSFVTHSDNKVLAGGSNSNASERPKGAQEVLHILYALKDCLPLMSMKFTTSIQKIYF